jgi:hypothetical protein
MASPVTRRSRGPNAGVEFVCGRNDDGVKVAHHHAVGTLAREASVGWKRFGVAMTSAEPPSDTSEREESRSREVAGLRGALGSERGARKRAEAALAQVKVGPKRREDTPDTPDAPGTPDSTVAPDTPDAPDAPDTEGRGRGYDEGFRARAAPSISSPAERTSTRCRVSSRRGAASRVRCRESDGIEGLRSPRRCDLI